MAPDFYRVNQVGQVNQEGEGRVLLSQEQEPVTTVGLRDTGRGTVQNQELADGARTRIIIQMTVLMLPTVDTVTHTLMKPTRRMEPLGAGG